MTIWHTSGSRKKTHGPLRGLPRLPVILLRRFIKDRSNQNEMPTVFIPDGREERQVRHLLRLLRLPSLQAYAINRRSDTGGEEVGETGHGVSGKAWDREGWGMKSKKEKEVNPTTKFRKELQKIMPGYRWTIKRNNRAAYFTAYLPGHLCAEGIQSAGFNRTSTLVISRTEKDGKITYYAKSAGFGKGAPWIAERKGNTLAQALRALQDHYQGVASEYSGAKWDLESGRKPLSITE